MATQLLGSQNDMATIRLKLFPTKEVSGRKVELDEVIVPSPLLENSSSQKSVLVTTTPISEEANDDDHVTSDQVTTESRR